MTPVPLLLALLSEAAVFVPAAPAAPPCFQLRRLTVVAPGPGETGVPTNTSLWILTEGGASEPTVEVTTSSTGRGVDARIEVLYAVSNDGVGSVIRQSGLRVSFTQDLAPNTRYAIAWRFEGDNGGHIFTTGAGRDDEAPSAPNTGVITGATPLSDCVATFGLSVPHDGDPTLLYLPEVEGSFRGLTRGSPAFALVGRSTASVIGSLAVFDLAGNRAPVGAAFSGVTSPEPDLCATRFCGPPTPQEQGVFSCTTSSSDGGLGVIALLLAIAALRRR